MYSAPTSFKDAILYIEFDAKQIEEATKIKKLAHGIHCNIVPILLTNIVSTLTLLAEGLVSGFIALRCLMPLDLCRLRRRQSLPNCLLLRF